MLLLALLVPLFGVLLDVVDSGRHVAFGFWKEWQLPDVCLSRICFNRECPACGLTRSVVHLMHGRWEASLDSHRLGWLVFALIVSQIPYRLWRLRTNRQSGDVSQPSSEMVAERESTTFSEFAQTGSDADAVA